MSPVDQLGGAVDVVAGPVGERHVGPPAREVDEAAEDPIAVGAQGVVLVLVGQPLPQAADVPRGLLGERPLDVHVLGVDRGGESASAQAAPMMPAPTTTTVSVPRGVLIAAIRSSRLPPPPHRRTGTQTP